MVSGSANNPDLDALSAAARWQAEGMGVALSIVMKTWGSSPRPVGSLMVVNEMGQFAGSVSGGCVEGAVLLDAKKAMVRGQAVRQSFGISDEEAWAASLACGGSMEVLTVRPPSLAPVLDARVLRIPIALAVRLENGTASIVDDKGQMGTLDKADLVTARAMLQTGQTGLDGSENLFVLSLLPQPRILIVGATHIAQVLAAMAPLAGFDVAIIDPRHAFNDPGRFPGVTHSKASPAAALAELGLDPRSAVVTLTHQPKIDEEALSLALDSPCFYIGALGSKKTHAARLERLGRGQDRIRGPVGLDIGAKTAGEIAVSILAEVIEVWRKGSTSP
ncbi:MAG: XdhC/CoxI family protein [Rhodospirillales bacterium]|nr:MAG: XdhC/CoxI family protein [Rhodospirillales bacterium]